MSENIIPIDFSNQPRTENEPEDHEVVSESAPRMSNLESLGWDLDQLEKVLQNKSAISSLCATLAIEATLKCMCGPRSSTSAISTHRDGLKDYTLFELHEIAEKSSPDEWQRNPAYFRALLDEITLRER